MPDRLLYADDCLNVLNDESALPTGSVDLIYLDPPFNSNSHYNLPFKGKYKTARPVEAFNDIWFWGDEEETHLQDVSADPRTRSLADIVRLAQIMERGEGGQKKRSLAAYLLNMAIRLMPMRRVLKDSGSIYLHCDPTASHYLKLIMDAIFGQKNFRNEVVWGYRTGGVSKKWFGRKHDVILFYVHSEKAPYTFNLQKEPSYSTNSPPGFKEIQKHQDEYGRWYTLATMRDVWDINAIGRTSKERLGYPTQKPLALLERIIKASSNEGDIVLDPFCGCGTTVHAAEALKRRWIGIDISTFATGLIRKRIENSFGLSVDSIVVHGVPATIDEAKSLARRDKFEFEKWVCGVIGAEGMFHEPGTKGPDGGVDGLLKFFRIRENQRLVPEYAIVQVKGGNVTPDAVRALKATVDQFDVTAGIMVCFEDQMRTVENQRSKETFRDVWGAYPVIQGFSVENLLANTDPRLPFIVKRQGASLIV